MFVPLILGLVSSLHCMGMCGPIAMMVPNSGIRNNQSTQTGMRNLINSILYNSGRITTYAVYGFVFGLIGRSFLWFGWQQKMSIVLGIAIIVALVAPKIIGQQNFLSAHTNRLLTQLRSRLSKLLFNGNPASLYGLGLLNGLLPCGMVYLALAGAVATGHALEGSLFMALFGIGTLPAMGAISYFGAMIRPVFRQKARQLFPAVMVIMATLLILRGMNLDIPYISPSLNISSSTAIECHD